MRKDFLLYVVAATITASPVSASPPTPWEDWTETDFGTVLWYRLKPSFPEQGPWILVRFYREPGGNGENWRVTRHALPVWESKPITTEWVAMSDDCPAISEVAEGVWPALSTPVRGSTTRDKPPINDGVLVSVGAKGAEAPSGTSTEVNVTGNLDTQAAAWVLAAEARLKPCWKKTS